MAADCVLMTEQAPRIHRIDLAPSGRGDRASMSYRGSQIGESHQPLLEASRWLLRECGASPNDLIETYRGSTPCMRAEVGKAAGLMVMELAKGGCRFVKYSEAPQAARETV